MAQYAQEERHIREENLRLQRRLQLEMERRENLCRHLSESESSLEMDDERWVLTRAVGSVNKSFGCSFLFFSPALTPFIIGTAVLTLSPIKKNCSWLCDSDSTGLWVQNYESGVSFVYFSCMVSDCTALHLYRECENGAVARKWACGHEKCGCRFFLAYSSHCR